LKFYKLLIKIIRKSLVYSFGIIIILLIKLVKPLILVRFQEVISDRLGHFACHPELYLHEERYKKKRYFDIFFYEPYVCNTQLGKMWKKKICVLPYIIIAPIYSTYRTLKKLKLISDDHEIPEPVSRDRDIFNFLDKKPVNIKFTNAEILYGDNQLKKMGLLDEKFIVLHIRDDNYINEDSESGLKLIKIENYLEAINFAIKRNYKVVRVGKNPKNRIHLNNNYFIDYPFSKFQNDFMDLYLTFRCKLIIGNNSGGTIAPLYLFRTPTVITDFAPIGIMHSYSSKVFHIFKKCKFKDSSKILNMSEIFSNNLAFTEDKKPFTDKSVELIDNTPEEIKDITEEAIDEIEGKRLLNEDFIALRKKFYSDYLFNCKKFNNEYLNNELRIWHGELKFNIGQKFLKNFLSN
jgi:putative glycosyltransferase (TIGR04372 family)